MLVKTVYLTLLRLLNGIPHTRVLRRSFHRVPKLLFGIRSLRRLAPDAAFLGAIGRMHGSVSAAVASVVLTSALFASGYSPIASASASQTTASPSQGQACQALGGGPQGYVLVGADGGTAAFGGDPNWGSLPGDGIAPAASIVGLSPYGADSGYWLVGTDGGVFAFGSCTPFYGSMAGKHLAAPIVGIASADTPQGWGYWLVGKDGGVFSFGHAGFYGSAAGLHLAAPIVGIAPSQQLESCSLPSMNTTDGYWLVGADGGVFSYGSATFEGSEAGHPLAASITGIESSRQAPPSCPSPGPQARAAP